MRRLTVKNFSLISQSELGPGKVTGLLGPQASGKSLFYNLASFLSNQTNEAARATILSATSADRDNFDDRKATVSRDFSVWSPFPTGHRSHACLGFRFPTDWAVDFATNEFEGVVF
jgi:ABC-type branched-subunit amino acid transport system ATPase component